MSHDSLYLQILYCEKSRLYWHIAHMYYNMSIHHIVELASLIVWTLL